MLFNSTEFLFVFLPVTLAGFYLLGTISRNSAIRWLILVSLVFYAWWRPVNVLIIAPSIVINYIIARILLRLNDSKSSPSVRGIRIRSTPGACWCCCTTARCQPPNSTIRSRCGKR